MIDGSKRTLFSFAPPLSLRTRSSSACALEVRSPLSRKAGLTRAIPRGPFAWTQPLYRIGRRVNR